MKNARPNEVKASVPGVGASIVCDELPARKNTVRADMLAMQTKPTIKKDLSAPNAQPPTQTKFNFRQSSPALQLELPFAPCITARQQRLLLALLDGPKSREEVDKIAGASNGPDEVMHLRRCHLMKIPCALKKGFDRDHHPVKFGVYSLTPADVIAARMLVKGGE